MCKQHSKHVKEDALITVTKLKLLAIKPNATVETHQSQHETDLWQHHVVGMPFFSRDGEAANLMVKWMEVNIGHSWKKLF